MRHWTKWALLAAIFSIVIIFGFLVPLRTGLGAPDGPQLCIGYAGPPKGTKHYHLLLGQYGSYRHATTGPARCNGGQALFHAKLYL